LRVHIGATWWIRLNCPCAVAMQSYAKLLWLLVVTLIVVFSLECDAFGIDQYQLLHKRIFSKAVFELVSFSHHTVGYASHVIRRQATYYKCVCVHIYGCVIQCTAASEEFITAWITCLRSFFNWPFSWCYSRRKLLGTSFLQAVHPSYWPTDCVK